MTRTGELAALLRDLDAVKGDGGALVARLSHAQLNWRTAPERWSVAECLDLLNVSVARTFDALDRAMAAGRAAGLTGAGPFRYGWWARQVVRSMEPPPRWRFKRLPYFAAPRGDHAAAALLPEFFRVRDGLARRLRDAEGLDLRRVKITSPASRWLRLPLGAYFAFLVAHDRRHLWQAHQVVAASGFPA